jgi:hypothetical protein
MPLPVPIDPGDVGQAVAELRSATLELLCNQDWLEHQFLLRLGLNDEVLEEFPPIFYPWCGQGLKSWQYPRQFSRYLRFLADQRIQSYVEVGCHHGGTFIITVEYLARFAELHQARALDLEESPILLHYRQQFRDFDYRICSSTSDAGRAVLRSGTWDLALIDGEHSRAACWSDYQSLKNNTRIIALHDIVNDSCSEVGDVWKSIRNIVPSSHVFEQTDQYREVFEQTGKRFLGIGAVVFR